MAWGIATSDNSGSFTFFRSTALNEGGLPKTLADVPGKLWQAFTDQDLAKQAWVESMSSCADQFLCSVCNNNGLGCRIAMYRIPEESAAAG